MLEELLHLTWTVEAHKSHKEEVNNQVTNKLERRRRWVDQFPWRFGGRRHHGVTYGKSPMAAVFGKYQLYRVKIFFERFD